MPGVKILHRGGADCAKPEVEAIGVSQIRWQSELKLRYVIAIGYRIILLTGALIGALKAAPGRNIIPKSSLTFAMS